MEQLESDKPNFNVKKERKRRVKPASFKEAGCPSGHASKELSDNLDQGIINHNVETGEHEVIVSKGDYKIDIENLEKQASFFEAGCPSGHEQPVLVSKEEINKKENKRVKKTQPVVPEKIEDNYLNEIIVMKHTLNSTNFYLTQIINGIDKIVLFLNKKSNEVGPFVKYSSC